MPVLRPEFEDVLKLGDVPANTSMANGELYKHLDEVEALSSALSHQVIKTAVPLAVCADWGAC